MTRTEDLDTDRADEEPTTSAIVALLIRQAVTQIRPEVEAVTKLLDELAQLADNLEEHDNDPYEAGPVVGDLLAVATCHLPNEVRTVAVSLRNIRGVLGTRDVTGVQS